MKFKDIGIKRIYMGDVMERIKEIPDETVDTMITSPPYYALRNYGDDSQWGGEKTFKEYLAKMDKLMEEVRRVLKPTGTAWVNLGDTYSGSNKGVGSKEHKESFIFDEKPDIIETLKPKSRLGIPERFYINCIDNGWIARNNIVWYKHNSMPSSVKDRFTNKYESVFFFAKEKRYYFDLDAVRVPCELEYKPSKKIINEKSSSSIQSNTNRLHRDRPGNTFFDDIAANRKYANVGGHDNAPGLTRNKSTGGFYPVGTPAKNPKGKNPGDIFEINNRPFPKAHFATFPVDLPLKILKCACPKPNGVVLDTFFGAGTTALAAEELHLNWIGIELNDEYIQIALERLDTNVEIL